MEPALKDLESYLWQVNSKALDSKWTMQNHRKLNVNYIGANLK